MGGNGGHSSGDIFLAFSTANAGRIDELQGRGSGEPLTVSMLHDGEISELFWGAIESTEEAICNALVAAETMTGATGSPRTPCRTTRSSPR